MDKVVTSLDEAEAVFVRKPETIDAELLKKLAGTYETPVGIKFEVVLKEDGGLYLRSAGQGDEKLIPYKGLKFRIKDFSDVVFEFMVENGVVRGLKQIDPSGEVAFPRK